MSKLKERMAFCVGRCASMITPRIAGMLESSWLDGADTAAQQIASEVLDSDGGTVMICGVEVMPVFPETAPELVERLRAAIRKVGDH